MATRKGTPVEPGILARVVAGLGYAATGKTPEWFGPGEPIAPVAQDESQGRQLDFIAGYNLQTTPRKAGTEGVGFADLRALADNYDLLRLLIETRKDQVAAIGWKISPKAEKAKSDARCDEITAFLASPDREHSWDEWLRMLIEDLLVLDAPAVYKRRTNGGQLYALEPVDGSTIKRVLDASGRTPMPPEAAYQQILKGVVASSYTREELIYKPRNPRTHRVYGFSPVEQVVMTVNIALRRQLHTLDYYTEGSIPDALCGVSDTWNVQNIKDFQAYWDVIQTDDRAARRRLKFVPGDVAKGFRETKQSPLKDVFDEWLARVCCFAFSIEPTPFVAQVNRSVAETAREQSLTEGLAPIKRWVKSLVDRVIATEFNAPDLHFMWDDQEVIDSKTAADIDAVYVNAKIKHPDEIRTRLGLDPLTPEQKADMKPAPAPGFGMPGGDGGRGGDTVTPVTGA